MLNHIASLERQATLAAIAAAAAAAAGAGATQSQRLGAAVALQPCTTAGTGPLLAGLDGGVRRGQLCAEAPKSE